MKRNIPITKPCFDEEEREFIQKPLETGWLVQGPYVAEFEKMFAEFTGASYSKATSNCTTALHLALEALGIGRGDKVIVPSFTYIASANAVEYTGAEVVFCDIDLRTFTIDVNKMAELIEADKEKRIMAVMPVNLFGLCSDLPAISDIAKKHGIKVIEDSACGLGAFIDNKHSGTFGAAGCFSFHPRKSITTGEGGMLVTDNKEIAEKVSSLRDHGAGKSDLERHKTQGGSLLPAFNVRGYNYRMTDIQGAIGVCQMKKARDILGERRAVAEKYNSELKHADRLTVPFVPDGYIHGYQSYVCLFCRDEDLPDLTIEKIDALNKERNRAMNLLEEKGIATRQGTHAVHTLGYYKDKYKLNDNDFLMSYAADRLSITLPLYAGMTDEEFDYVVENLREVFR